MRFGVLGGTFNPVHYGHLRAAEEVRQRVELDRVLFVPSGIPPLKVEGLAPADSRLRMVQLAIASNPYFQLSDVEVHRKGPSFTVDTIASLRSAHPDDELYLILGTDAFSELPKWYRPGDIAAAVDFIIVGRPPEGFLAIADSPFLHVEQESWDALLQGQRDSVSLHTVGGRHAILISMTPLDISASKVRKLVGEGRSIKYLLPEDVELFIMSHGLYRNG